MQSGRLRSPQMQPIPPPSGEPETPPVPPPVMSPAELPPELPPANVVAPPRSLSRVFLLLGPLLAAAVLGYFIEGEVGYFLKASWEAAALAVLCVLGYAGLDRRGARVGAWLYLVALLASSIVLNLLYTVWALLGSDSDLAEPASLPPATLRPLALVAGLSVLAALAALPARLAMARRLCGAEAHAGEWTSVRTLALSATLAGALLYCVPLLVLGAPPVLLALALSPDFLDADRGVVGVHLDALYALCWTLVAAALAVGYGITRNGSETLARLGLHRVSRREVAAALGLTVLLLGAMWGVGLGIESTWQFFQWPATDVQAFSAAVAPFINPLGAVVIGVTAGMGEEIAVRGILQPRLGIWLSNLLFTAVHAYQYHWDALLSVFLVGFALGLIRKRSNTTVCIIVHGAYDFVLVLGEYLWGGA